MYINTANALCGGGGDGWGWFPFQKQACNTADSWFISRRRLCLDRLTSLSAHVNSIITEVHVGYLDGIFPPATRINYYYCRLPPLKQSKPQHVIWHSRSSTLVRSRLPLWDCCWTLYRNITHATIWWHMPPYVLRPCSKVTRGLSSLKALLSLVPAHSIVFWSLKKKEKLANCTEGNISLSSPFCYVQELAVMKYFYSLMSWMSTLAVKWIIR